MENEEDSGDAETIGDRIEQAIREAGFPTQTAFAEQIGKSRQLLNSWVKGRKNADEQSLELIAEATGRSVSWLRYGGEDRESRVADLAAGGNRIAKGIQRASGEVTANRAMAWIGRAELGALRRAEGELHYGDLAVDAVADAKEKEYNGEELLTLLDWLARRLKESERKRVALQRSAGSSADQPGPPDTPDVRNS